MPPYIYERQIEQWANTAIYIYLTQRGYLTFMFPPGQPLEHHLPSDVIFGFDAGDFTKIFGLQYKALYSNDEDHWQIDRHQHSVLEGYDWMYYALSDLDDPTGATNILHHLRFAETNQVTPPRTNKRGLHRFTRWGSFFEAVRDCRRGGRISSPSQIPPLLDLDQEVASTRDAQNLVQILVINETRRIVALTSGVLEG